MKKLNAVDLLYRLEAGCQVDIYGWVKARRKHNRVVFLDVCDSTGFIQAVVDKHKLGSKVYDLAKRISPESAVRVAGPLVDTGRPKPYSREILANSIELIGPATLNISPHPRSDIDIFSPNLQ